jgi:hypothetical protein
MGIQGFLMWFKLFDGRGGTYLNILLCERFLVVPLETVGERLRANILLLAEHQSSE